MNRVSGRVSGRSGVRWSWLWLLPSLVGCHWAAGYEPGAVSTTTADLSTWGSTDGGLAEGGAFSDGSLPDSAADLPAADMQPDAMTADLLPSADAACGLLPGEPTICPAPIDLPSCATEIDPDCDALVGVADPDPTTCNGILHDENFALPLSSPDSKWGEFNGVTGHCGAALFAGSGAELTMSQGAFAWNATNHYMIEMDFIFGAPAAVGTESRTIEVWIAGGQYVGAPIKTYGCKIELNNLDPAAKLDPRITLHRLGNPGCPDTWVADPSPNKLPIDTGFGKRYTLQLLSHGGGAAPTVGKLVCRILTPDGKLLQQAETDNYGDYYYGPYTIRTRYREIVVKRVRRYSTPGTC